MIVVILVFAVGSGSPKRITAQESSDDWPTDDWRTSTPEEQGMDSEILADMLTVIREESPNLHSVLVIRHGQIVVEAYPYPYSPDLLHDQRSITKSNIATLIGIAIADGDIESVNQPLLSFFPERTIANREEQKEAVTLEHLLSMASGLDGSDAVLGDMIRSADWVQFMLDRPMIHTPGSTFEYSSGSSHVLSAILSTATGMNTEDYARQKLYDPLGITDFRWQRDWQGLSVGGFGLWMSARDMAKLGFLYLHNGEWDGQQIVAADWVETTTQSHGPNPNYGYQWWLSWDNEPYGHYGAGGYGAQQINVIPDLDMVVVFTAGLEDDAILARLLNDYIYPATQSDEPLPENAEAQARLAAEIEALAHPTPDPIPTLPDLAPTISGRLYQFDFTPFYSDWVTFGWETMSLSFEEGVNEATVTLGVSGENITVPMGLDNVVRLSDNLAVGGPLALRGTWQDDHQFEIEMYILGMPVHWSLTLTFSESGDVLTVELREHLSGQIDSVTGTWVE
jgi:CubicO group peptidase (beta-lactamase class C family)